MLAIAVLRVEGANSPTFLADNQAALARLLQAAERPICRYPVALTNVVTVLRKEAVSQAVRWQTDAATTATFVGFRLARSLDNEPLLISSRAGRA